MGGIFSTSSHAKDDCVTSLNTGEGRDGEEKANWLVPRLSLTIEDALSQGARRFFAVIEDPGEFLSECVTEVIGLLYFNSSEAPKIDHLEVGIRSFRGVAYTFGDKRNKTIHFSSDYIAQISNDRLADEIKGVIVHGKCFLCVMSLATTINQALDLITPGLPGLQWYYLTYDCIDWLMILLFCL